MRQTLTYARKKITLWCIIYIVNKLYWTSWTPAVKVLMMILIWTRTRIFVLCERRNVSGIPNRLLQSNSVQFERVCVIFYENIVRSKSWPLWYNVFFFFLNIQFYYLSCCFSILKSYYFSCCKLCIPLIYG